MKYYQLYYRKKGKKKWTKFSIPFDEEFAERLIDRKLVNTRDYEWKREKRDIS